MPKPYKSIRVFKSPYLEKLTHVHPLTPLFLWAPVILWLLWRSFAVYELNPYTVGALGMSGFLVWTLLEYVLHRFIFHYQSDTQIGQRLHFLIHGLHHDDPLDPTRLVMPPVVSVVLSLPFFAGFKMMFGEVYVEPFFAFFLIGYLCYDYIHFYVHHFIPTTKIGKYLKHSHMIHHYVDSDARWGVSSPLWDYIFGTVGTVEQSKEKKQTI